MAKTFPTKLPKVPPSVARTFRKLKKLPDDFTLWLSFQTTTPSPHFLLLWKEKHAFLIHVAETSQQLAESALQTNLFSSEQITIEELGKLETQIIQDFQNNLHKKLNTNLPVTKIILFPNVEQGTIDSITLQRSKNADTHFLGLNQLSPTNLPIYFQNIAREHLPAPQILHLRRHFNPETIIPISICPLTPKDANTTATLTEKLLDLDQEWIVKNNLYLPPEAQQIANQTPEPKTEEIISQLVTGVAGSGKSLVLLYRALLNANLNPQANILVLTHNKPINNELQRRFQDLNPKFQNVQWLTFFGWATKLLRPTNLLPDEIIPPFKTQKILDDLNSEKTFSSEFLAEEIAYIKDLNITKKQTYLTLPRTGRGKKLSTNQRTEIWAIAKQYHDHLTENNLIDWNGVAILLHQQAQLGNLPLPAHDCILIDEAQFFAKSWFDTVLLALRPGGQLFLSADPTQGFLKRRQSWIASGIDVRGRSTKLTKAYRNTKAILTFAKNFYNARIPSENTPEDEDLNIPTNDQINQLENQGTYPEIIHCPNINDTHNRAANEISKLAQDRKNNISGHNLILLHAHSAQLTSFQNTLTTLTKNPQAVHNAKDGICPSTATCQTSTLNAATGLEAPYIFLLGIDHLLDKENNPLLTPEEKTELITTHTRQLYMAFTRASQKLIILTTNPKTQIYLQNLTT